MQHTTITKESFCRVAQFPFILFQETGGHIFSHDTEWELENPSGGSMKDGSELQQLSLLPLQCSCAHKVQWRQVYKLHSLQIGNLLYLFISVLNTILDVFALYSVFAAATMQISPPQRSLSSSSTCKIEQKPKTHTGNQTHTILKWNTSRWDSLGHVTS